MSKKSNFLLILFLFYSWEIFCKNQKTSHGYNAFIANKKVLSIGIWPPSFYFKAPLSKNLELGTDFFNLFTLRPNFFLKYKFFPKKNLSFLFHGFFSSRDLHSFRPRFSLVQNSSDLYKKTFNIKKENAHYYFRFSPKIIYTHIYKDFANLSFGFGDIISFEKYDQFSPAEQELFADDITVESHDLKLIIGADFSLSSHFIFKTLVLPSYLFLDIHNLSKFDEIKRRELSVSLRTSLVYLWKASEFELGATYGPEAVFDSSYDKLFHLLFKRKMKPSFILKYSWRFD